jgi:FemAB-related protein (PEP-CTERM system-associated)
MGTDLRHTLRVREVVEQPAWDALVSAIPNATPMHRWAWKEILAASYGHRTTFLGAFDGDVLRGAMPLVLLSSRLFGRRLVSMPFGEGGGPCSTDEATDIALMDAAVELAGRYKAALDVRSSRALAVDLPVSTEKVAMVLDLPSNADELWTSLPSERRNRIKKAKNAGLSAHIEGADSLDDFYEVFARNMRDLGSPVHARAFFQEMLARLGGGAGLVVVRAGEQPVGAALFLEHCGTISIPWVSSLREHFSKSPNQLLYWRAMEHAIAIGAHTLDFGRSSIGTGTFEAKRQWGARPVQQYWYHYPERAGSSAENAERFNVAMRLWRRLPLGVANRLGPRIRGSIAN